MKIAIISDIHGNLKAFNMFLKYIEEENVEKILNLGDYVRGKNQEEVIDIIINDNRFNNITGNHEEEYCKECELGIGSGVERQLNWIKSQEQYKIIEIEGVKILMIHSRLCSNKLAPLIYSGSSLDEFMEDYPDDVDLVCFGHTHIQLYMENFYGKRVLNPGSLGIAIDKKVNFAIIEINKQDINYKFIKLKI